MIYDCRFVTDDVRGLARHIKTTSGVVDHGLFLDMATEALIGHADGRWNGEPGPLADACPGIVTPRSEPR